MFLEVFFPKTCLFCSKPHTYLCLGCLKKLQTERESVCYRCQRPAIHGFTHPACQKKFGLDGILIASSYDKVLKKTIHAFKYRFIKELEEPLGKILNNFLEDKLYPTDIIIPVPLHSQKSRQREFNQSLLLAEKVSQKFHLPLQPKLLIRKRATSSQTEFNREERYRNLKNAFHCPHPREIEGKKILLIDDVATTFTTLEECSKVLKKAGARKVWAAVLAHGR